MTKVFISGSRAAKMDEAVRNKIKNWTEKGYHVLVGDCRGIDTEVQKYLADCGYQHVTVCCSITPGGSASSFCRNLDNRAESLGWEIKGIATTAKPYTRAFFTAKDKIMTDECDIALVVWDGVSAGSKANIDRAVSGSKQAAVRTGGRWLVYDAKHCSSESKG